MRKIKLDDIEVEVTYKKVKNVNLRVYPADKRVALSCPHTLPDSILKKYLNNKIGWIKKNLHKSVRKNDQTPALKNGDKLPLWGKNYPLVIDTYEIGKNNIRREEGEIFLTLKKDLSFSKKQKLITEWYRSQIKEIIPSFISKWEPVMGVKVNEFGVKRMKTRWGTCNIQDKRIWLNLFLVEKPIECLEMVIVHEMTHLLERLHTPRFYGLMDKFLPDWREAEKTLKSIR